MLPDAFAQADRKVRVMADLARHPFREPWWLRGRHAQTVWSVFLRRLPIVAPRLEEWETPDDDFLRMHFIDGDPAAPLALLLHGLEGGMDSNYMVGLAARLAARGWNVAAMEFRSCGGAINRAARLYHTGETTDLDFVVRRLASLEPSRRIFLHGVSLGGNVVVKWLGEQGDAAPSQIVAAAAICPPFDLAVSGPNMDRVLGGLYARRFLRTLIPKALEKARQYPDLLDAATIRRARSFAEFDTHATARLHGFRDNWDYWRSVGCGQFLAGVRRPTLLVAAEDDPFNPASTLPREAADRSPWLHPLFTRKGGHVGFVHGPSPRRSRHWAKEQAERFFKAYEKS